MGVNIFSTIVAYKSERKYHLNMPILSSSYLFGSYLINCFSY